MLCWFPLEGNYSSICRGTNVTQSLMCDENEKRTIVSVDMTRMCKIKWVDKKNMMACV